MKIETISENDSIIHSFEFDNLFDLANYVETAKINEKIFTRVSSAVCNPEKTDWYGSNSFEEAVKLCRYGDFSDFDQFIDVSDRLEKGMPHFTQKRNIVPNSYGHRPDIRKSIMNNPNSMLFLVRNEQCKFVRVYVNITAAIKNEKPAFINRGVTIINIINFLENIGYRVRLDFFEATHINNEYIYAIVNLKNEGQKLDIASCYFPMCSPAFLRRIIFRVIESAPVKYPGWSKGYGMPMDLKQTKRFIGADDNSIVISEIKEMGVRGYDIFSDAERMFELIEINRFLSDEQKMVFDKNREGFTLSKKF